MLRFSQKSMSMGEVPGLTDEEAGPSTDLQAHGTCQAHTTPPESPAGY